MTPLTVTEKVRQNLVFTLPILLLWLAIEFSGCGSGAHVQSVTSNSTKTLTSLLITPNNSSIALGNSEQFVATGVFSDNSREDMTQTVAWSSQQPEVATITPSGVAHSKKVGTTTIKAVSASIAGSTTLTVSVAALISIVVTPPNLTLPKGSTQQLTATATFTDGSTQDMTSSVSWAVSPSTVASVASTGLIHAQALGSASITATSGSVRGTDTLTVSSPTLVSIGVTPPNPSVPKGNTQQLAATASFTDGSTQDITNAVAWTSSSPGVATVSSNGLLSAHALGTASIKASSGSISGIDAVTVSSPIVLSIAITPSNPSIALGFKQQFKAMGMFTDGSTQDITKSVTWTTAQAQIATISALGQATSLRVGTTGVSAAQGSISGFASLSITPPILLSISIEPTNTSIPLGSSKQLQAIGTFSNGRTLDLTTTATWSSAQSAIASVRFGVVLGKEVGTTTISALSGSVNGSGTLTVTSPVLSSIAVTPANPHLEAGSTVQLTATGTSTDGSTQDITNSVEWTASPTSVTSVSKAGLVTGQGPGRAMISAVSGGVTGADTILVSVVSLVLTPASPELAVGSTMQLHAVATFSNGSSSDVTTSVTWSSTTPAVAAIRNTGVAMGETAGTTTVSANYASLRASAVLTVRPMVAINYFANANIAGLSSATVNVSNTGLTATGLCAMFYVFDESEEMSECCGCQVSIDDLRTLSVDTDLTGNPLTGSMPTRGVVKIVSADMASNPSCDPSSIAPKGAVVAWSTHLQSASQSSFVATEGAFRPQLLSNAEQSNLQGKCASIKELGSGHGICMCGSGD
jgi:uncharacterized protein YjdB